jgi:subtilisin family serine protease
VVEDPQFLVKDDPQPTKSSTNCSPSCKLQKRDNNVRLQSDAPPELRVISQPEGVPLNSLPFYAYNSVAGGGVTVYVVDSGANTQHPVCV